MAGISDVARLAAVSKATASRALTGNGYVAPDTRARVRAAADELGYTASTNAVSLATGRTSNIGVIMPYANRWFFAEVLEGIQGALLQHGLDLTLYDAKPGTPGRARIFGDFLARKRFDGLIAVGIEPEDGELELLRRVGRPLVSVVGLPGASSVVAIDDDHTARRATEHLITLGHRRIAFIGGPAGEHGANVDRQRLRGYRATMADAGIADLATHVPSEVSLPGGYEAAVDLLGDIRRRPTGIVAVCDEVAIGAIIAARRLGIQVPSDLSVVGIDDHEYAEMFSLTTLRQIPREQGAAAVELLLAQLRNPPAAPVDVLLTARLVVRSSTGPVDPQSSAVTAGTRLRAAH
ncbi:LacI family DNA-binding transcriptional regulator [Micromonospora sp. DT81.3]|uniref:LacI family DNA-binding transcriptional regulator n=1 Tax=Actinomycetes TaxID=1760 RepID=UPI003CF24EB8